MAAAAMVQVPIYQRVCVADSTHKHIHFMYARVRAIIVTQHCKERWRSRCRLAYIIYYANIGVGGDPAGGLDYKAWGRLGLGDWAWGTEFACHTTLHGWCIMYL